MALTDVLSALLGGGQSGQSALGFGQTAGAVDPGQSTAPGGQTSTPLSELMMQDKPRQRDGPPITMAPPPSDPNIEPLPADPSIGPAGVSQTSNGPTNNYNNSSDVSALRSSLMANQPQEGGMTSPGLYGLLPQNLQHGTLRGVLGSLGDALLVSGGRAPAYANEQARQQVGNAMAGMDINDPASVQAAAQRVAATGAPGAAEMADKMTQQGEQAALRKQYMEYNNDYRQGMLGARQDAVNAQKAAVADRYRPQIGGMLSGVTKPAEYAAKYASLGALAKQLGGPDATPASVWSLPEPANWTPELTSGYGQTAGQQLVSGDKAAGRQVTMRGQNMNQQNSQGRDAAIRARPGPQENATTYLQGLIARNNGQGNPLNPDEQAYLKKSTTTARSGRSLPPGLTPGGAKPAGAPGGFVNGHVYRDAHGNTATYMNGKFIPH